MYTNWYISLDSLVLKLALLLVRICLETLCYARIIFLISIFAIVLVIISFMSTTSAYLKKWWVITKIKLCLWDVVGNLPIISIPNSSNVIYSNILY
jgi:hypothetical protein